MTSMQVTDCNKTNIIQFKNQNVSSIIHTNLCVPSQSSQGCWYICMDLIRYQKGWIYIALLGMVFYHVFVNLNNGIKFIT